MTTLVAGGGVSGLLAALLAAERGEDVVLCEARQLGGSIRAADLGGVRVDVGAEAYSVIRSEAQDLVDRLGLPSVAPATGNPHLILDDVTAPIPPDCLLGIPSDIGTAADFLSAAELAEANRRDALPISDEILARLSNDELSLGDLVRERLGDAVVRRLVDPVVRGVHAMAADRLSVDRVAPGLRNLTLREGSVQRAVRSLRRGAGQSGTPVRSIPGGMTRLVEALITHCRAAGVDIREGVRVESVETVGGHVTPGHSAAWHVVTSAGPCDADHVVLAISADAAAQVLCKDAALAEHLRHAVLGDVCVMALRVRCAALDDRPLGSGALIDAERIAAKGFTHASAKWQWLHDALLEHEHIVRLSYGRDGEDPRVVLGPDAVSTARGDLELLVGAPVEVLHSAVQPWPQSLSHPIPQFSSWREQLREYLTSDERSGLAIQGPGLTPNGIVGAVMLVQASVDALMPLPPT